MKIGIDFDNTLVNYTSVFYRAALEKGLITVECGQTKFEVKKSLHNRGMFDEWTMLQGYVYGKCMHMATLFDGVIEFLKGLESSDIPFSIISHKTRIPFIGPAYDLHKVASEWIKSSEIGSYFKLGENLFFEETIDAKLNKISTENMTHFIDDLEEIIYHSEMPKTVETFLFKDNWREIQSQLLL